MVHLLPDGWHFQPRVMALPGFAQAGVRTWVLRDDETGFAISAGKLRKYQTLVPRLVQSGFKTAILIGGQNSNNLVGLAQTLLEAGIRPVTLQPEAHAKVQPGFNQSLLQLLLPAEDRLSLPLAQWPDALARAQDIAQQSRFDAAVVIPEGCFMPEGVLGSQGLAKAIEAAQSRLGLQFTHVFVDAGTGTSAIGMLLGAAGSPFPKAEIVLLGEGPEKFRERMSRAAGWLGKHTLPVENHDFRLHRPGNAAAFGAVNRTLLQFVKEMARNHGLLLDPIYTGKLFFEARRLIPELSLTGDILIVHSGGANSLPGFMDALLKP